MLDQDVDMSKKKNHSLPALSGQIEVWKERAADVSMPYGDWARRALIAATQGRLRVKFTDAQLIRGRTEREEIAEQFQFKVTDEDVTKWQRHAEAEGLARAEWCRQVLDAAAEKKDQSFLLG